MKRGNRELLMVGDRVLVKADDSERKTKVGLVLPPGVVQKEDVQGGQVVAVGPGIALPPPQGDDEPWKTRYTAPRYLPLQVREGDYALFHRKAAVEIRFDDEAFLVVPYAAILVLVRGADIPDELPEVI